MDIPSRTSVKYIFKPPSSYAGDLIIKPVGLYLLQHQNLSHVASFAIVSV